MVMPGGGSGSGGDVGVGGVSMRAYIPMIVGAANALQRGKRACWQEIGKLKVASSFSRNC